VTVIEPASSPLLSPDATDTSPLRPAVELPVDIATLPVPESELAVDSETLPRLPDVTVTDPPASVAADPASMTTLAPAPWPLLPALTVAEPP
jgi:hypothetical protein